MLFGHMRAETLTSCNRSGVDTVDCDAVRVAQLLCPHSHQRLVRRLRSSIDRLTRDTQASTSRGDEDNATSAGQMRDDSLSEENRATNIAVEVCGVELGCGVYQVGLETLRSTTEILDCVSC